MSNAFGWVAPGYLAPADWTSNAVRLTVVGNPLDIPHTGLFVANQGVLDAIAVAAAAGFGTALIFLKVPPMGYTYDPASSSPSRLYPTPALIAEWLSLAAAGGGGGGGAVSSVNSFTGAVVLTASDIGSSATGGVAATNVQAAIAELDSEKAPKASPAFTGNPTAPTPAAGDNDTSVATTAFAEAAIRASGWPAQFINVGLTQPASMTAGTFTQTGSSGFHSAGSTTAPWFVLWNYAVVPGTWRFDMVCSKTATSGIMNVEYSVDGGTVWLPLAMAKDFYNATTVSDFTTADVVIAVRGRCMVRVQSTGTKNASSTGYYCVIQQIAATRVS